MQSKGGNLLAVATNAGYVTLFDAETGALISSFPGASPSSPPSPTPPTPH